MIKETNKVFIIIAIFLGFSSLILLLTHNDLSINNIDDIKEEKKVNIDLINSIDYALYLRPILISAIEDNSLENITFIREKLFIYNENNKSIGLVHINLFLAFDTWQDYLNKGDNYLKDNIIEKLDIVLDIIPELDIEINKLKELL